MEQEERQMVNDQWRFIKCNEIEGTEEIYPRESKGFFKEFERSGKWYHEENLESERSRRWRTKSKLSAC
jgi:hypothetical protein